MQNKKIYILFLLLAVITLSGAIILRGEKIDSVEEEVGEPSLFYNEMYVYAESSPVFIKQQVLATKREKSVYELLGKYDWNVEQAYRIVLCESSGIIDKHNFNHATRDDSWGLFQINLYGSLKNERPSAEWLKVAENNIDYAYKLWVSEGRRFGTTGGWFNCGKKEGIW